MAVSKFSQIALASPLPVPTDYVVGVTAGNVDFRSPISTIVPVPEALSNLTFYVATTGSDSNPGTITQPFATVQHAVAVLVGFDYGNQFFPSIQVADGTYTSSSAFITLPNIPGIGAGIASINGNNTNPQNCILSDGGVSFTGIFFSIGTDSIWAIKGFEFQTNDVALNADLYSSLVLDGNNRFNDVTNVGSGKPMQVFGGANITFANATLTIVNSAIEAMFEVFANFSAINCGNATINLPATSTLTVAWLYLANFAFMTYRHPTVTNAGGLTGSQINISNFSVVETSDGDITNVTGQAAGNFVDSTSGITNTPGTTGGFFAYQISGLPTGSNLTPGTFGTFKDTSGGGVYLAYNDAGTIKKVALV